MSSTALTRRLVAAASVALVVGALSACGSTATSTTPSNSSSNASSPAAPASTVTVTNAYVNAPTMPTMTGAFATLTNSGAPVMLMSVSVPSDVASAAEVHETVLSNGSMTMQPAPSGAPVPEHGTLMLKSGGFHIMLMEPKVSVGQTVPITFTFSDGTSVTADAMVKAAQASPMPTS